MINDPLIYLSLYLKQHRSDYYAYLQTVRLEGNWEAWISFFLKGISEVANHAYEVTDKICTLFDKDAEVIRYKGKRKQHSLSELHRVAKQSPVFTASRAETILRGSISKPTLYSSAEQLCDLGILQSKQNEKGTLIFFYKKYLNLLLDK